MKKILLVLLATFAVVASAEAAETKKVCHDVTVKGKTTQQCKHVKIHKKYEGTTVPTKAPAKPAAKPVTKPKTTK
jgi:cell division septation protein DedD